MKFSVKTNESVLGLGRFIGYISLGNQGEEHNFARSITGNRYPRFHVYVRREKDSLLFNLHLDQKQPSYGGHTAHSGEYDGEIVERETERIKRIFGN